MSSVETIIIGLVVLGAILLFLSIVFIVSSRGKRPIRPDPSGRFPEPPSQDWLYSAQRRFSQLFLAPPPEPEHHHHHHHQPASMPEPHHHHFEPPMHHEPPSPPPMHHHS